MLKLKLKFVGKFSFVDWYVFFLIDLTYILRLYDLIPDLQKDSTGARELRATTKKLELELAQNSKNIRAQA